MSQSRHTSQKPSAPARPVGQGKRPLGVQRMSRKTWDKVRQAIRALEHGAASGAQPTH